MPKRSSKTRCDEDVNTLAFDAVQSLISQLDPEAVESEPITGEKPPTKNPAAVALGRLGGQKGGPARAAKLSAKKRKAIAKKAAGVRWSKKG